MTGPAKEKGTEKKEEEGEKAEIPSVEPIQTHTKSSSHRAKKIDDSEPEHETHHHTETS